MSDRVRIGDLLVAAKLVTAEQVSEALVSQRDSGRRLGEELVAKGFVSEFQLTQILSNQLAIPWVSLQRIEFTRDLLNMVPAEVANRLCVIPIYMRRVRAAETLYVAMDDPTNEPALIELAATTGLPVKAMVSSPSEIRHAIRVYYLGGAPQVHAPERRASRHPDALEATQAAQHTVVIPAAPPTGLSDHSLPANAQEWESGVAEAPNPEAAPRAAQPPAAAAAPPAAVAAPPAAAPAPLPDSPGRRSYSDIEDEPVEASEPAEASDTPAAPAAATSQPGSSMSNARSRMKALRSLALTPAQSGDDDASAEGTTPAGVKMVTLTLLDGSTVRLPAPGSKRKDAHPSQAEGGLTASDLVSALLARAQGADVSDVLPDQQWEVLFASLLTLLIRKGLLADWEFVEEWKKRQGS